MLHPGNNLAEADDNSPVQLTTDDLWEGLEQKGAAGKQLSVQCLFHIAGMPVNVKIIMTNRAEREGGL